MIKFPEPMEVVDREARRAERLDERRATVLASRDPVGYFRACQDSGLDEDSVELPELFLEGATIIANKGQKNDVSDEERDYWAKLVKVALTRFPECNLGEIVHVGEVKRRLGQIRQAGYNLVAYSRMDSGEAWDYLMHVVRPEIRRQAQRACPGVLVKVDGANERQRVEAMTILR